MVPESCPLGSDKEHIWEIKERVKSALEGQHRPSTCPPAHPTVCLYLQTHLPSRNLKDLKGHKPFTSTSGWPSRMKTSLVPHLLKLVTGLPLSEVNKVILTVVDLTQVAISQRHSATSPKDVVSDRGAQFYQFSLSTFECVYEFQPLLFPDQEKKSSCPSVQTFILLSPWGLMYKGLRSFHAERWHTPKSGKVRTPRNFQMYELVRTHVPAHLSLIHTK